MAKLTLFGLNGLGPTRSRPTRTCRCSTRCATISAWTIPISAAGWRSAAPARCISTAGHPLLLDAGGAAAGRSRRSRARHPGESAPGAEGLSRGAGAPVRLLHQRLDHDGGGVPRRRRRTRPMLRSSKRWRDQVPLRHACADHARGQARRRHDGVRRPMNATDKFCSVTPDNAPGRGALVVSSASRWALDDGLGDARAMRRAEAAARARPSRFWLSIGRDGKVTLFFGKIDGGQGPNLPWARSSPKSSTCRCRA